MGIDVYLEWKDKDDSDRGLQTGILADGACGYLREAYHGEPYATKLLLKEAFQVNYGNDESYRCRIDSEELEARLPEALKLTAERFFNLYKRGDGNAMDTLKQMLNEIVDFVDKFKQLEAEEQEPFIEVSY
jgi:hypothetical protein